MADSASSNSQRFDLSGWLIPSDYKPPPRGTTVERELEHRAWFQFCRFLRQKKYIDEASGLLNCSTGTIQYINFPIFSHYKNESGQHPPWIQRFPIAFRDKCRIPGRYRSLYQHISETSGFSLAESVAALFAVQPAELPRRLDVALAQGHGNPTVTIEGDFHSECLTVGVSLKNSACYGNDSQTAHCKCMPPSPCKSSCPSLECIETFWNTDWWTQPSSLSDSCAPSSGLNGAANTIVNEIACYSLFRDLQKLVQVARDAGVFKMEFCRSGGNVHCCTLPQLARCLWDVLSSRIQNCFTPIRFAKTLEEVVGWAEDALNKCCKNSNTTPQECCQNPNRAVIKTLKEVVAALKETIGPCRENSPRAIDAVKLRIAAETLGEAVGKLKGDVESSKQTKDLAGELEELAKNWRTRFGGESWRRWLHLVAKFTDFLEMNWNLGFTVIRYLPLCIPVTARNYSLPEYWGGLVIAGGNGTEEKEDDVIGSLRSFVDVVGPNIIIPDLAQVIEVGSGGARKERERRRGYQDASRYKE